MEWVRFEGRFGARFLVILCLCGRVCALVRSSGFVGPMNLLQGLDDIEHFGGEAVAGPDAFSVRIAVLVPMIDAVVSVGLCS